MSRFLQFIHEPCVLLESQVSICSHQRQVTYGLAVHPVVLCIALLPKPQMLSLGMSCGSSVQLFKCLSCKWHQDWRHIKTAQKRIPYLLQGPIHVFHVASYDYRGTEHSSFQERLVPSACTVYYVCICATVYRGV